MQRRRGPKRRIEKMWQEEKEGERERGGSGDCEFVRRGEQKGERRQK